MHRYLIALGSNQRHGRYGAPKAILSHVMDALDVKLLARSAIVASAPLGPSKRNYANAAAIIKTKMEPPELLEHLKAIEAAFGRRSGGRKWQARVLDLDIILWSGGFWSTADLAIPHPAFRTRDFVLRPAAAIAADWRDPLTGLRVKHLKARLDRRPSLA
jgi:2-amino-4-hydroxy-6-hydroxymethyldihydropteridine diphosphokinase